MAALPSGASAENPLALASEIADAANALPLPWSGSIASGDFLRELGGKITGYGASEYLVSAVEKAWLANRAGDTNSPWTVEVADWTLDSESGLYYVNLTHNRTAYPFHFIAYTTSGTIRTVVELGAPDFIGATTLRIWSSEPLDITVKAGA
jgi:hypothetical protein